MDGDEASRLAALERMSQLDDPSDGDTSRRIRLEATDSVFKLLAGNAQSSVRPHKHDKPGLDRYQKPKIAVTSIVKVDNPELKRRYLECCRGMEKEYSQSMKPPVITGAPKASKKQRVDGCEVGHEEAGTERSYMVHGTPLNECFLFHGTNEEAIEGMRSCDQFHSTCSKDCIQA